MSAERPARPAIPEPWFTFLREVDAALEGPAELHCAGGFAVLVLTGGPRVTGDVDVIEVLPGQAAGSLERIAGKESEIAARHRLQVHFAPVVKSSDTPSDYAPRLLDVTPPRFHRLRIKLLEPHDLALTKLSRNLWRDREDVRLMVEQGLIDRDVLEKRYQDELRPYVLNEQTTSLTMELWLDEFFGGSPSPRTRV